MKKKLILLPLLMLVLASCVPNNNSSSGTDSDTSGDTSSGTSADMTSDTSSGTSADTSSDTTTDTSSGTSSDTTIDPVEKNEIDPTELNAILGYDVYSLLPKIYSNDYEVGDYASESYPVDVYIDLFDWELDDAIAYETALEGSLDVDEDNGYIVADNLYIFIYQDSQTYDVPVFGLNLYSIGEAPEKEEIDPTELNEIIGFDVYSQIPAIYSNDYEVGDYSSEDYPVDIYIDLYDWTFDDALAYDDELFASLDFDENYGYIIDENLFVFVNYDSDYSAAYINIYSDAAYEPFEPEVSAVWPADAINAFFGGAEIGGLVPSFTSEADFSYYITGEDDYVELIIYTDYATVDGEDVYVAALEAAGWVVDDSAYDIVGYVANDPDEQISLFFYWYDGVIYWSFMSFYHEEEQEDLLLEDGETVVLYNSAQTAFSAAELESKSEWYANNDICNFNGNDQIALSNNGVVIDMVGVLGNNSDFAKDTTLVRNASVSSPSATYNASEWTSSAKDTVSNVGSHTMDGIASDLIISEYVEGGGFNKFIEIYNGTGEAIDLVNYAVTLYVNGVAESPNNKTFEFSSLLVI